MNSTLSRSGFVVVAAASLIVMACGSDTSSTTAGKGIFGVGIAAGGVPTSCNAAADDKACTSCLKTSCCTVSRACATNQDCSTVLTCSNGCADDACVEACIKAHPTAQVAIQAMRDCAKMSCTACGGTTTADQCLPGAQDPTYCTAVPNKQTVKDCPNGSPSPMCVPSPTGSRTVYCCP